MSSVPEGLRHDAQLRALDRDSHQEEIRTAAIGAIGRMDGLAGREREEALDRLLALHARGRPIPVRIASGHALAREAPLGISLDGKEGPGSYGLNRNVTLTILVGKEGKVTANFPLVQPSIQADLPKILQEIAKVAGGPVAKLEDLPGVKEMLARKPAPEPDAKIPGLVRAVIQKTATPAEVDKAAAAVEEYVKGNEAARKEVGRIARTVVEGGKLADYGTPKALETSGRRMPVVALYVVSPISTATSKGSLVISALRSSPSAFPGASVTTTRRR